MFKVQNRPVVSCQSEHFRRRIQECVSKSGNSCGSRERGMVLTKRMYLASALLVASLRKPGACAQSLFRSLGGLWLTLLLLLPVVAGSDAFGWSAQHQGAAWLGATIAPEPFKSNADLCRFALYPDWMNDWWTGHGRDDIDRILFTFEAIEALRANDIPKALFFASAATHYPTDRACIAHSGDVWKISPQRTPSLYAFLPRRYQAFSMPGEMKTAAIAGLATPTRTFFAPAIPAPPYRTDRWVASAGDPHTWGDALPDLRAGIDPRSLVKPTGWTYHDFSIYANWYASFLTVELFDPQSLETGQPKWRDAAEMKAVLLEELRNGAQLDAAYYGYLATAANTVVEPPLAKLIPKPQYDKLQKLSETRGVVLVARNASWPMKRAAHLLAYELCQAQVRWKTLSGQPKPGGSIDSFILETSPEKLPCELADHSAVVLLPPENEDLAKAVNAPGIPVGKSGIIAARQLDGGKIHVFLRGATQQDTLYLVDYLFDLVYAPNIKVQPGRWPVERVMDVYQQFWPGWKLIADMKTMSGNEAASYAEKLPHKAAPEMEPIVKAMLKEAGVVQSSPTPSPKDYFLLSLPLPDGRRVPDCVEKGREQKGSP